MKCASCGSNGLVEGSLIDSACAGMSLFQPKNVSILKRAFGGGTRSVRAYGCIQCQHLQLAVDFSEEDVQRYRNLEGENPDSVDAGYGHD